MLASRHGVYEFQMPSEQSSRVSSRTNTPSSASPLPSDTSERVKSSHSDGHVLQVRSRKRTQDQLAESHVFSGIPAADPARPSSSSPGRSPFARLKRFSSLSLSNLSSKSSSQHLDSPSFSLSTRSTAPFISQEEDTPHRPNKLVKRSMSQRTPEFCSSTSFRSRIPTRRTTSVLPILATDQTDASPLPNGSATRETYEHPPYGQEQWRQILGSKIGKLGMVPKRVRSSMSSSDPRRIVSDGAHQMPATPSSNCAPDDAVHKCFAEDIHENKRTSVRRITPSDIVEVRPSPPMVTTGSRRPSEIKDERPRRSFSISNLLALSPPSRNPTDSGKAPPSKLKRKHNRRIASAPTGQIGRETQLKTSLDGQRPSKRRETEGISPLRHHPVPQNPAGQSPRPTANEHHEVQYALESPHRVSYVEHRVPQVEQTAEKHTSPLSPLGEFDLTAIALAQPLSQPSRYSFSPSDLASTIPGSDNDTKMFSSGDEDEVDRKSDTVYDSLRTGVSGVTRSSSGTHGSKLERLFDIQFAQQSLSTSLLAPGKFSDEPTTGSTEVQQTRQRSSSHTNNESLSAAQAPNDINTPSLPVQLGTRKPSGSSSSSGSRPPRRMDSKSSESLRAEEAEEDDDEQPSEIDSKSRNNSASSRSLTNMIEEMSLKHTGISGSIATISARPSLPQNDYEMKNSLFDWSEQPPIDRDSVEGTPQRPRTVHGKKDTEARGSRSAGRRATTTIHVRSQSVPAAPDFIGKRKHTNKYQTWNVGSKKGATEDWDEDFDFDDTETDADKEEQQRIDSGVSGLVPDRIQQQQTSIRANIGLLREWGMLIEELKGLRMRTTTLGLASPTSPDGLILFEDVDAMIQFADEETEHEGFDSFRSSAAPLGFDGDEFDDTPTRRSRSAPLANNSSEDDDFWTEEDPTPPHSSSRSNQDSGLPPTPVRRDSEAAAKSVFEAVRQRRTPTEVGAAPTSLVGKKLPFDTATLRHFVPNVQLLLRQMKQVLREAEGLNASPILKQRQLESPFSHVFMKPTAEESPPARKQQRQLQIDEDEDKELDDNEHDTLQHMRLMTVM